MSSTKKPCRWGTQCTRKDCSFDHPQDENKKLREVVTTAIALKKSHSDDDLSPPAKNRVIQRPSPERQTDISSKDDKIEKLEKENRQLKKEIKQLTIALKNVIATLGGNARDDLGSESGPDD